MEDREVAYRIANLILWFDGSVFLDNPIPRVEVVLVSPEDGKHWIAYHYGRKITEHYDVFVPGLANYLQKQLEGEGRTPHLAMMEAQVAYSEVPWFTENELLVAIAAHEVRHRVQRLKRRQITLLTPKNTEPAFMGWALHDLGHRGQEFDAKVIGFLAAKEWKLGHTSLEEMAQVIRIQLKGLR